MNSEKKLSKVFTVFYRDFYITINMAAFEKCSAT
jgi:hypothetical protein